MAELDAATPDVSQTDISAPPEIELIIVARRRQVLRNTAIEVNLALNLAKKRKAVKEVESLGTELDKFVRDITEIDTLYPEAKKMMDVLDAKAIAEGRV